MSALVVLGEAPALGWLAERAFQQGGAVLRGHHWLDAMLLVGVVVAYGLDSRLSIGTQVAAHSAVILGPSLLKIGYVMRLLAQHLQRKAGWERCCASA